MPIWEYKVITSGKGGFATPALLEKYLNDLGREEWEIIEFHNQPDNFLAFTGLARRPTQRDWTLEDAAAAAAKAEADKLRAEFEAKFKAASGTSGASAEEPASLIEEKLANDDGFRKPIDTSHDADAEDDEKEEDDWDKLTAAEEDELPNFFEAIRPHMRRNQRGPGMSVGVDYLAKKWGQSEEDLKGALAECGFAIPEDEDAKPEYLDFEGDLYWVNVNRRGELWINTKEKPRPVFRAVKGQKVSVEEEQKPERGSHKAESSHKKPDKEQPKPVDEGGAPAVHPSGEETKSSGGPAEPETPSTPLPSGPELLQKIRPFMRRNRRGPGGSGSVNFLSRALKCREADLVAGFKALGFIVPANSNEKPTNVEFGNEIWWINVDSRGGIWINGREKKASEVLETPAGTAVAPAAEQDPAATADSPAPTSSELPVPAAPELEKKPDAAPVVADGPEVAASPVSGGSSEALMAIRPLLKETRTGSTAAKLERIAEALEKPVDDVVTQLRAAGLAVPEKPREKPVFVEQGGEIFWLNRNAKGELWLNTKASKSAGKTAEDGEDAPAAGESGTEAEKKPRRPRTRKKSE